MKFLIDAQLPPALAGWLREAGHEAEHVEDGWIEPRLAGILQLVGQGHRLIEVRLPLA